MLIARFSDSRLLAAFWLVLFHVWTGTAVGRCLAAEDDPDDEPDTEAVADAGDIVVTDSQPSPALLYDDPSATTERIDVASVRERYADLGALLDDLAGVHVTSFGGVGRSASVSLRGSSGKQVLVLLDGVPLNANGEAVDLSTIPLDQLAMIEVTRGAASALYGGGAVGGVVNLVLKATTASDTEPHGSFRGSIGSQRTSGATYTGWRTDADSSSLWQLQTDATRGDFLFSNDNGTTFNGTDDFADRRVNNESQSASFLIRQHWGAPQQSQSLTATLSGFARVRGEPGIATFPSPTTDQREQRLIADVAWRSSDWWLAGSETEIRVFGRLGSQVFQDPEGEQTGTPISSQQQQSMAGVRAGSVFARGEAWLFTILLEATHEELHDRSPALLEGGADHARTSLGAALRGEWTFADDWTLVSALRGDVLSDQPDRLSPRLGLAFAASDDWTLRASAGNAYRPPSFSELADSRGFVVGNPDLRPEVARAFDLSADFQQGDASFSISFFRTETKDLIEYVQLGGFRFKPLNFGRALSEGLELSGAWSLDDSWTLQGAWTAQSVTDATGGANRAHQPIPGRPGDFGQATLAWHEGEWESAATWNYVGSNSVTLANTKQLPARDTLDWSLVWRDQEATIAIQIANLLDDAAADLRGFPLPGRTWSLAYTHSW